MAFGDKPARGMTLREHAAIQIMAGFAADPTVLDDPETPRESDIADLAYGAVEWADALIEALEDTQKPASA